MDCISCHGRMHHVRYQIDKYGDCTRVNNVDICKEEWQWCNQENNSWQAMKEVDHGIQEAKPLRNTQAPAQKRVIQSKNLNHTSSPADSLANVGRQGFST